MRGKPKNVSPPSPAPVRLKDMMQKDPEAFDFSSAPAPPPTHQARPHTLTEMLGGFTLVARDAVSGLKLYARAPKVAQLERLWDLSHNFGATIDQATDKMRALFSGFAEICAVVLFVPDGDLWRHATVEEVKSVFDLAEMRELAGKYTGLKPVEGSPDPNA